MSSMDKNAQQEEQQYVRDVTKVLFWIAFGGFFAWSLPHVAAVFRHFEPDDSLSIVWWITSYIIALSFDGLACWLSYTYSAYGKQVRGQRAAIWTFILLIVLLSAICNWIFEKTIVYGPGFWKWTFAPGFTVEDSITYLVALVPIFIIAYTLIAKHILGQDGPLDLEAVRAKNNERVALARERQRVREELAGTGMLSGVMSNTLTHFARQKGQITHDHNHFVPGIHRPDTLLNHPADLGLVEKEDPGSVKLTWNTEGKVTTVQFPGKAAVRVDERHLGKAARRTVTQPLKEEQGVEQQEMVPTSGELPRFVFREKRRVLVIGDRTYYSLPKAEQAWHLPRGRMRAYVEEFGAILKEAQQLVVIPAGSRTDTYISREIRESVKRDKLPTHLLVTLQNSQPVPASQSPSVEHETSEQII